MYVRVLTSRSIKPVHVPLTAWMCVLHCWTHHWTHHRIVDTPFSPSHQSADAWSICSTAGARSWRWTPWLAGYHSQSWSSPVCVMTLRTQEWWWSERRTFLLFLQQKSFFLPVEAMILQSVVCFWLQDSVQNTDNDWENHFKVCPEK